MLWPPLERPDEVVLDQRPGDPRLLWLELIRGQSQACHLSLQHDHASADFFLFLFNILIAGADKIFTMLEPPLKHNIR